MFFLTLTYIDTVSVYFFLMLTGVVNVKKTHGRSSALIDSNICSTAGPLALKHTALSQLHISATGNPNILVICLQTPMGTFQAYVNIL